MPIRFWETVSELHVYLMNKLPLIVLEGKILYELLLGKMPKLDNLRVFGCLFYASRLPRTDKFTTRARRVVLIGYSKTQKGYRLYDLEDKQFFVSRDITFRESIFCFKENQLEDTLDMFLFGEPITVPPCEEQHSVIPHSTPAIAELLP